MSTIRATLQEILRTSRGRDEARTRILREFADREPVIPFLAWRVVRREVTVRFGQGDVTSVTAECTDGFVEYEPEPVAEPTGSECADAGPVPVVILRIGRPVDPSAPTTGSGEDAIRRLLN
ncbi:hypothetical protein HY478_01975 [Candidatus Uhrbacteria bacterium]|nr:hypothetical protein [Candidatus Uhrbacteria bacterium]